MIKRIFIFLFIVLVNIGFHKPAYSSHIVGGELNYKCLGSGRYEIILTVYRDCFFGNPLAWFDNPASVGFFDQNNALVRDVAINGQLLMFLMNNDTLSPVLNNPCFVVPPSVCVHTTTYRDTVDLPFRPGGYQLAYQRCCRNETILNIVNPDQTGATFYTTISETALLECNSNATFDTWPPIYICLNEPIEFDHSASDIDGDSLVYRLCTPLTGAFPNNPLPRPPFPPPYDPVVWRPPYAELNMLGGDFPLTIDIETGLLTGLPSVTGQFVVGICVDEFRDGFLISTTRRDFQYNVGVCGETVAAFSFPEVNCQFEVTFLNMSSEADSVLWIVEDPLNPGFTSTTFNLTYRFSDIGTYEVTLITNPGAECTDTLTQIVRIIAESPEFTFEYKELACTDSLEIQLTAILDDAPENVQYLWFVTNGIDTIRFEGEDRIVRIPKWSEVEVSLTIILSEDCSFTLTRPLETSGIMLNPPATSFSICPGESVQLDPGTVSFDAEFSWMPGDFLNDPELITPVSTPGQSMEYILIVSIPGGCSDTAFFSIQLFDEIDDKIVSADPDTIFRGQFSQLFIEPLPGYIYSWTPSSSLDNPFIFNPVASPQVTTTYSVQVTDENGCTAVFEVVVAVVQFECELGYVYIPNTFSPNGDSVNDTFNVRSEVLEEFTLMVYNRWGQKLFETNRLDFGWNGTFNNNDVPIDTYAFYFEGRCIGGEAVQLKGSITLIR